MRRALRFIPILLCATRLGAQGVVIAPHAVFIDGRARSGAKVRDADRANAAQGAGGIERNAEERHRVRGDLLALERARSIMEWEVMQGAAILRAGAAIALASGIFLGYAFRGPRRPIP